MYLEGAENRASIRQRRADGGGDAHPADRRGTHLGQAEIQQLGMSARHEHDVARLEVPVDDPLAMRLVKRVRHLDGNAERLLNRQPTLPQRFLERLTLEELHDEEPERCGIGRLGMRRLPDVVERADRRMRERRDDFGFALEALAELHVGADSGRQDLDRDNPIEPDIECPVDFTHPAGAAERLNLVVPEPRTWSESHVRSEPRSYHRGFVTFQAERRRDASVYWTATVL